MKHFITLIVLLLTVVSCSKPKTELILMGTVHSPVTGFNADSLYNIFLKVKPDVILFECDSSFFTKDFTFKSPWNSNENIATRKYMKNFDVIVRPYDFTGRNEYRKRVGSRPTDHKTLKLLDSLYQEQLLDTEHQKTYKNYLRIDSVLSTYAYKGPEFFNQFTTDRIAQERQSYQYKKLLQIVQEMPIFSNRYHHKTAQDSISYREGFTKASEFWHLRNKSMANHIATFTQIYKGKRIIVLNGFFHRYYLQSELQPKQEELNFNIIDFYDY